ncbi:MAG: hypothetical protein OEM63_08290 [Gammaproteobacteria bacterium]|nr:hypothetical protein [Gammaproteobacteria bacterium]
MFEWLETTPPAIWVGESLWGYPIMLGCHAVGLAIVVGIFLMRDLRLIGLVQGISYESLDSLRNLAWTGFVINAVSGCFLFTSQATVFIESTPFLLKISMIFLAAICAAIIQNKLRDAASQWDSTGAVAGSVRTIAMASTALWIGAIISGRLVAYL